jgi:amino acid adenylation domain-containing protein
MPATTTDEPAMKVEKVYPLSPLQEGMLFHSLRDEGANVSISQYAFHLEGHVDAALLERSFEILVGRHEILRTRFVHENLRAPHQVVVAERRLEFTHRDLRAGDGDLASRCEACSAADRARRFDLARGPLMCVSLLRTGDTAWRLVWTFHHILLDGWSTALVLRDLFEIHALLRAGAAVELPPARPFADFIDWQQKQDQAAVTTWWRDRLGDFDRPTSLAPEPRRGPAAAHARETHEIALSASATAATSRLAVEARTTLSNVVHACWAVLLQRYNDVLDVCFGGLVSGRPAALPGVTEMVGLLVNTVPIRLRVEPDRTFRDLLRDTQEFMLEAATRSFAPLAAIQGATRAGQDLLDHILVFENYPVDARALRDAPARLGFAITRVDSYELTNFDLTVNVIPHDELRFRFTYNAHRYPRAYVEHMAQHLVRLLDSAVADPDRRVVALEMVGAGEARRLLAQSSGAAPTVAASGSIGEIFAEVARAEADRSAAVCDGARLTYRELEARSARLAGYLLRDCGLGAGEPVGVLMDRSIDMVVALLAIVRAGGAYVPIDPAYPRRRIELLVEDAALRVLLIHSHHLLELGRFDGHLFAVDAQLDGLPPADAPLPPASPATPAYILYTSGSTGRPKGVVVPQRAVVRLVKGADFLTIQPSDRILQTGSMSFDASTLEVWGALLNGATLFLAGGDGLLDHPTLRSLVLAERISVMWLTSSWFNQLSEMDPELFRGLRCLLVGGEALSPPHINRIRRAYPALKLLNGYGPTENTTFSATYAIEREHDDSIPIGRPIAQSELYVLHQGAALQPVGLAGEICVAGAGLACGYLNDDALTREKFVPHPFRPGERMYRTGDRGRWLDDGHVAFLGRADEQVKVRGYRIEPGEIELVLQQHEDVAAAAVIVEPDASGGCQLRAFVSARGTLDVGALRSWLETRLPAYMVPGTFVPVDGLPLTANGKVDKRRLAALAGEPVADARVAPRTELERRLAAIWCEQLGLDEVGVRENYFQLGGDSIRAIRLVSTINKAVGASLQVKDVFSHPDIESMAAALEDPTQGAAADSELSVARAELDALRDCILADAKLAARLPADWEDVFPMSDIQQGMIFHAELDRDQGVYHDQMFYRFRDPAFALPRFRTALERLVAEHPILRTSFRLAGFPVPIQVVHRAGGRRLDFEHIDADEGGTARDASFFRSYLEADRQRRFSYELPGLWRMRVFSMPGEEYVILTVFHHAILDGWSYTSFMNELIDRYDALQRRPDRVRVLRASYRDYVADQIRVKRSPEVRDFWRRYLDGYRRTPLPLGKPVPERVAGPDGLAKDRLVRRLEPSLVHALEALARASESQVKDLGLAAYLCLLQATTGAKDVTVGLLTHGRPEIEDGERVLGCFLNSTPFRIQPRDRWAPAEWVAEVAAACARMKAYDKLPVPEIRQLVGESSHGGNPFFDVFYAYLDFHVLEEAHGDKEVLPSKLESHAVDNTPFDLLFSRQGNDLYATFEVARGLYDAAELARLGQCYVAILERFAQAPRERLDGDALVRAAGLVKRVVSQSPAAAPRGHSSASAWEAPAPPRDALERRLVELWRELLRRSPVGIRDGFFELGGHSLLAMRMLSTLWKEYSVRVDLRPFYREPRIEHLAELVRKAAPVAFARIEPAPARPFYSLSPGQRQFWINHTVDQTRSADSIHGLVQLRGAVDAAAMRRAFAFLTARHESLRTTFLSAGEVPRQRIRDHVEAPFDVVDLRGHGSAAADEARRRARADAAAPFDLGAGPLFRVALYRLDDELQLLSLTMHHIISDGWSTRVLSRELWAAYAAIHDGREPALPPLAIQYKDYVAWLEKTNGPAELEEHRLWWSRRLRPPPAPLALPLDRPRPEVLGTVGRHVRVFAGAELHARLARLCDDNAVSLYAAVLAAYRVLLYGVTRQEDVIVGTPMAGRDHEDLHDQIGLYVNLVPLRLRLDPAQPFVRFLRELHAHVLEARGHQLYPFDELVADLQLTRDRSRSVIFDTGFTWDVRDDDASGAPAGLEQVAVEETVARWDLWLFGSCSVDGVELSLTYNTSLFDEARIELYARRLLEILQRIADDPEQTVAALASAHRTPRRPPAPEARFKLQLE